MLGIYAKCIKHSCSFANFITFQCSFANSCVNSFKKTALYDFHIKHEGKMIDFAGYSMPLQYGAVGISDSHLHVRKHCGLFDVSHMLQTKVYGKEQVAFIESLIVADVKGLPENSGTLSLFTTPSGGIIDDLICTKTNENFLYIVSNAGCKEKDIAHMMKNLEKFKQLSYDINLHIMDNHGLIALQGPEMVQILQPLVDVDLDKLYFMQSTTANVAGINCRVTRCGYTGEDGVEISVPNDQITSLCEILLSSKHGDIKLVGLGARDTLRLEAGLCLYGNDINEKTTPVEAGLAWTVAKARRDSADFPGAEVILQQLTDKPIMKRIGLISDEGPPMRQHCSVLDGGSQVVGEITSGCPSPSLRKNIAMAYLPAHLCKSGQKVHVKIRGKLMSATVTKMPFVSCNYYVPKK